MLTKNITVVGLIVFLLAAAPAISQRPLMAQERHGARNQNCDTRIADCVGPDDAEKDEESDRDEQDGKSATLPVRGKGALEIFSPTRDAEFNTDTGTFRIGPDLFGGGKVVTVFSKVVPSGVMAFDFESINVPLGVTDTMTGSRPLILLAEDDAVIDE
jgi:hypothetical protein